MTEVLINNFEYIMKVRERVILCLAAAAICCVASYAFFMEKTIANTVALTSIQSVLAHENETVSSLSSQYVALSSGVTLASALAEGFVEAPVSAFVTVPAPAPVNAALSINTASNTF
jgi:hypothetical protein